jgi:hypothetical protein
VKAGRRTLAALASLTYPCLAAVGGCDRDAPHPAPHEPEPVPVASVAKALGMDASEVEPAVDPPAAAGDLQAEIQGFTTLDACVEQHAHLDPLLGDALEAIGYDTFVRDACRVLEAAKAADGGQCDAIDASSLRHQCACTVAAVKGDAEGCPWTIPSRPESGRDAWCLAVAARDPRLCAAEETSAARATCEATVRHDPTPCAKLPVRADQARCRRDVDRWRNATPAPDAHLSTLAPAQGTLHVDGGDAGAPLDTNLEAILARGVVLLEQRDGVRFELGLPSLSGSSFIAASPHTQPTLSAEIFAASDGKRVTLDRVELSMPNHSPLSTPLARSTIEVKIDKLDHVRGGALGVMLDGDLGDSTGTFHVHLAATTFVRDVVSAKAMYGSKLGPSALPTGISGFGDAGFLR